MQEALKDLETQLDKLLGKGSPYQMTEKSRRALAGVSWLIALIIGIVQAWGALALWQLGHVVVNQYIPGTTYVAQTYPYAGGAGLDIFFYLSFVVVLVDAALLLIATPQLKEFSRRGWQLAYYALLLNLVYSFLRIFSTIGGGFGQFIVALFFSAVLGYFLFQTKTVYTSGKARATVPPVKQSGKVLDEDGPPDGSKKS